MVDIVVPIYKEIPSVEDDVSLNRLFEVLGQYDITFVYPEGLELKHYKVFHSAYFKPFHPKFFSSIYGYNQLMMSALFYNSFHKEFILIYQTDAFVFQDDLTYWLAQQFDYVGAPWLGRFKQNPLLKQLWDYSLYEVRKIVNYKGIGKFQKNKSLLYNQVGNGGFSLRKREKFIDILTKIPEVVHVYLLPEISGNYFAEDVFFSIEPERHGIAFAKPDYRKACAFSIENKPEKAKKIIENQLPFGCHRWTQQKDFWRQDFENLGYKI